MKPTLKPGDRITPENARLLKVGDRIETLSGGLMNVETINGKAFKLDRYESFWTPFEMGMVTFIYRTPPAKPKPKSAGREKDAQKIADVLFGDAERLVQELPDKRLSGGWCKSAAIAQIQRILNRREK